MSLILDGNLPKKLKPEVQKETRRDIKTAVALALWIPLIMIVGVVLAVVPSVERKKAGAMAHPDVQEKRTEESWRDVTITTYRASAAETDDSPCITADGTNVCHRPDDAPRVCAVSRDLLKIWPFGTRLELQTLGGFWRGACEVHDCTHERFTNRVDILIPFGVTPGRYEGKGRQNGWLRR